MVEDIIRIGYVGAGGNTRLRHLPGFAAIDGVENVSVSEPEPRIEPGAWQTSSD